MEKIIYLVEDEAKLSSLLKNYLTREGYQVKTFLNGKDAEAHIVDLPDLWVLDIMLPDIDGFTLFKEIKAYNTQTPIIFMSARDSDIDRLLGLQLGSEDYIAKPFLPQELVLRCNNVLRRQQVHQSVVEYGGYKIYETKRLIFQGEEELKLTTKEFDLLLVFIQHINQSLTREQILNRVWGPDYFGSDRVVDDLVRRLKKKCPNLRIESIYGYGYRLK